MATTDTAGRRPLASTALGAHLFVVPAYNEEDNLPRLLADLEARPDLFPAGSRLVIVDDGSSDRTCEIAREYRGWLPLELLAQGVNQGPGAAFRAGFARVLEGAGSDDLVITLEADTTSDLEALGAMCALASGGADLVLASVHGGGRIRNASLHRVLLSRCAGIVVRRAMGLDARTVSSFFRVYRADALARCMARHGRDFMSESGFACKAQVLAQMVEDGARIEEVPVDVDASRRVGESKMRIGPTIAGYWRVISTMNRRRRHA